MKMTQALFYLIAFFQLVLNGSLTAQENNSNNPGKMTKKTEQLNTKTSELNKQTQQSADNIKSAGKNIKSIVAVFEPILSLRLKKKNIAEPQENNSENKAVASEQTQQESSASATEASDNQSTEIESQALEVYSVDPSYNSDGTANLGNQNHPEFGCYIDIMTGTIMDEVDVAGQTGRVDLIFTATDYYGSAPMYAFLTPSYVKNDLFSNYYFRGPVYKDANIPVRQWDEVNESEVALTNLTAVQFDKIKNNDQLMAVVKKTPGFKDKIESRTKIEGKIFAIKTEMGSRTTYGLLQIVNQYGTTGKNGYLKIKLKVTGLDSNGDGIPDIQSYQN
ncbi:MAG: hypothetical protein V9E90_04685 [Saprospiraceae bacterium]|jgi:hypothetical protein